MAPRPTCTTHSAATTKEYFTVARCDGVGRNPSSGSFPGRSSSATVRGCDAKYHTMPPTPASSSTKLTMLQTTVPLVGWFAINGSCGQFCVYVTSDPGRFVDAAHAVHQKNALISRSLAGSPIAPRGMA